MSEESFWLCAYLDERAEVVQCASSALVGRAYSALENSMLAFFEEAIWNSWLRSPEECSGETTFYINWPDQLR